MPWTRFRNLCSYYIDCVKYSEKRQEYIYPDKLNQTFLMPRLPFNWHLLDSFEIETTQAERFARNLLITASEEDELFIGYPLSSFYSAKGTHGLSPLLLFPVDVTARGAGFVDGLSITINRLGIDINREWLEFRIPREQQTQITRALEQRDDVERGIDVENVLCYLSNRNQVNIDPNGMDFTLIHADAHNGILNTAALFVGNRTRYTRTLIKELSQIRNMPDAVLDRTALAYVFRNPIKEIDTIVPQEKKRIPVTFTKGSLNAQQYRAVEEALNKPACKVTGPPGTGKSHMSVNLIANEVFYGGSVLFTSKNHKAVHAVFDMYDKVKSRINLDLVEFCTVPGNEGASEWNKLQSKLETIQAFAQQQMAQFGEHNIPEEIRSASENKVDDAIETFREVDSTLKHYDELRKRVSEFERLLVRMDELLACVPEVNRQSPELEGLLSDCLRALEAAPHTSLWRKLWVKMLRKLNLIAPLPDVRGQLTHLLPDLAPVVLGDAVVARRVRRLLCVLQFRKVVEVWRQSEYDVIRQEQSTHNYDELLALLFKEQKKIQDSICEAYCTKFARRAHDVEIENLIREIQNAVPRRPLDFMMGVSNGQEYEVALLHYQKLLYLRPAWAATMLSMRKVSPLLPGAFSLVVIDEASQCEIPPMIPTLFRAQRVTVVGDPAQFPPVITLSQKRNDAFRRKYGIVGAEMDRFSFREPYSGDQRPTAYSVVPRNATETIRLTEHFRCTDEITRYFNEEFYEGTLCPSVGDRKGQGFQAYNLTPGMEWIDVAGGDEAEIEAACDKLIQLRKGGFKGSVGVISPLRELANRMETRIANRHRDNPVDLKDVTINTANGFQGGQCDVILFLLGLNMDRRGGELWYITGDENKYIYNVSVSRAKVCFIGFGDRQNVLSSDKSWIRKLIPTNRAPNNPRIGPGERILEAAMRRIGLNPVAQYPVSGKYLDLALVNEKIDIEVDGQAWHLDRNGCRKADDIHRDLLLSVKGWRVMRFWHHEVMTDAAGCAQKIQEVARSIKGA